MGSPARVGDADGTLDGVVFQFVFEGLDFSGCADNFDLPLVDDGDPRAIIATIFHFLETFDENR